MRNNECLIARLGQEPTLSDWIEAEVRLQDAWDLCCVWRHVSRFLLRYGMPWMQAYLRHMDPELTNLIKRHCREDEWEETIFEETRKRFLYGFIGASPWNSLCGIREVVPVMCVSALRAES